MLLWSFMMKSIASLLIAGLSLHSALAQMDVPPNFQVGVKWQIIIQNTINTSAPLQPADALVWDLDLYHIARTPGVVNHLRVRATLDLFLPAPILTV